MKCATCSRSVQGMRQMSVTIEDVAKLARVSVSTVSRVLNNKGRISQETRHRVLEAARELQHPLMTSRLSRCRRRSDNIGILFNKRLKSLLSDPFYGLVMEGVEEVLRRKGYHVFFSTLSNKDEDLEMITAFGRDRKVDGLIMAGCDVDIDYISKALEQDIPLVLVDNNLAKPKVPCVVTDNVTGAREAVEYLIQLGHRDIGFVSGPMSHSSLNERFHGFRQALDDNHIALRSEWIHTSEDVALFGVEGGYEGMKRMLARPRVPTAVLTGNDFMAFGVVKAAQEAGLRVPEDLSVIGFDDVEMAAHSSPPLSTVRVRKKELGILAAKLLFEMIDEQTQAATYNVVVHTELVIRQSVASKASQTQAG